MLMVVGVLLSLGSAHAGSPATPPRPSHHRCHGLRATIVGNGHKNTIVGTKHRDIIWAGPGRDRVAAKGGKDLICGGKGADVLDGMKKIDTIYGGGGTDWCVSWSHREHARHHHGCEVHIRVTKPHGHPGTRNVPQGTKSLATKSLASAQSYPQCGINCSAGSPACGFGLVTWDATAVSLPRVNIRDSGYVNMLWEVLNYDSNGNFSVVFNSGWVNYGFLQGGSTYLLKPVPMSVSAPNIPYNGSGFVAVWFTYSQDGVSWSPYTYDVASQYTGYLSGDSLGENGAGACFT